MVDKTALSRELKMMFIRYQFRLENPFPQTDETDETAIIKYKSDNLFHAKVDALTYGVMNVVDRHI